MKPNPTKASPIDEELDETLKHLQEQAIAYFDAMDAEKVARKHEPFVSDREEAKTALKHLIDQAVDKKLEKLLDEPQLPWPRDVFGEVPKDDWDKIDKFATKELGYRMDTISATLMRRGWANYKREVKQLKKGGD